MISHTAEYAMRAAVYLAAAGRERVPAHVIAAQTGVPTGYLPKVLVALSAAGLVNSRKGPAGGYCLSRGPEQISLLEVVRATERVLAEPDLPPADPGALGSGRLRTFLGQTHSSLEAALARVMLAEMVD